MYLFTKQKQIYRYGKQTYDYQKGNTVWGGGGQEVKIRNLGLTYAHYYIYACLRSHVWDSVTPCMVTHQACLSIKLF